MVNPNSPNKIKLIFARILGISSLVLLRLSFLELSDVVGVPTYIGLYETITIM